MERTSHARVLSGMRSTGNVHLGNYFGALQQFLELQEKHQCFFFVADLHALTEVQGPTETRRLSVEVVKTYLACGIDPARSTLYQQSDVPQIAQLAILLGNTVGVGRLRSCTTYKDRIKNKGAEEGDVSLGLLAYPVLMAADILAVRGSIVPVGKDQKQHIEMARDFAKGFNQRFQDDVFTIPDMNLLDPIRVPGIDGSNQKMGKSLGNTIALLDRPEQIQKKVMKIPTQERSGVSDISPGTDALFQLVNLCCSAEQKAAYAEDWKAGRMRFGEVKQRLAEALIVLLTPIQDRYDSLRDSDVRDVLSDGAKTARGIAQDVLEAASAAMGL